MSRTVCWFSCGAASAVATLMTLNNDAPDEVVVAYTDTGSEHEDNDRFLRDCERHFGRSVVRLKSRRFENTWEVWEKRKFLSGVKGAPCTRELKVLPRLRFQRPDDIHVFGYTAEALDQRRAERFQKDSPELKLRFPLIDAGLTKAGCLAILDGLGIREPVTYAMGYPNANCIPCVKATSPRYWALVRKMHPEHFYRMAELSRRLNVRLTRINDERIFIDEIPEDYPVTSAIVPACDFLCSIADSELRDD